MESITDRTAQFSAAVALIYEALLGDPQRDAMKKALCAFLGADELVFIASRSAQLLDDLRSPAGNFCDAETNQIQESNPADLRSLRLAGHILSLDIADRGYEKLRLLVLRNSDRVPFTEGDLAWLSLLRPHLQQAEFVKALMSEGVLGSAVGNHLVHSMSEGLVITALDGKIEWLNSTARGILATCQGLMCTNGRLRAARAFETARIETLIREAAAGRQGVMLVGHASMWLPYGLVFTPLEFDLRLAAVLPATRQRQFVLVTIKDMQLTMDLIVERLAEVFGLTKAEQEIGALLLTGHSLQASADVMGKSLPTVKKQLRSMLNKTGTHNQAELLCMFLSVPSLI
jgi:DNA-binding CsgD family transcriptional regulator